MHKTTLFEKYYGLTMLILVVTSQINAQTLTTPQVSFTQRTSSATPTKTVYNVKGDFTLIGNTNLTLVNYSNTVNNEGNSMKYVDIDGNSSTLNSSMATLELSNSGENGSIQNCSTIIFAGLYWTGKSNDASETFSVTKGSVTKNYDKKVVSLKGPGATTYTSITAKPIGPNYEIRFPGAAQSGIFIGYQEITDYVKTHGPGAYTVADIALTEGTNANPGFSGGWVMIVIYENQIMKSRAITLFDGYAYVNGQRSGGGEFGTIPISGFTTVAAGQVNMKLGVIAAEGDVATNSGSDYLAVQKLNANPAEYNNTNYLTLNHAGNSTDNFFNSSIFPVPAIGKSNPILKNNTGVDFSMFTIPNPGNSVIGNNQTSTTFRFGSTYEVYTIFGFAMSVDAYVPEPEGVLIVNSIDNVTNPPQPYSVLPGKEISYTLNIKNKGTEAINNNIVTIPISNIINFVVSSISFTKSATVTTTNVPYYDSGTQSIIWNMGTLPLPVNPEDLLATITFKVRATDDCAIIINNSCTSVISVSGTLSGVGAISGVSTTKAIFKGFDNSTGCQIPITSPTTVTLDNSGSPCFTALAGPDQVVSCGGEIVYLSATSGTSGIWTIVSGPSGGGEVFSNNTSTSSTFYSPNVGPYLLRWTTSCAGTIDDVLVTFVNCNILNFDGIDDNVTFKNNYSLSSGSFSVETWIKSNAINNNIQTIFSKRNGTSTADGYDLKLVNNIISFNWNGNSIASTYPINSDRWYHIAVTFNGTSYKLYIDGIAVKTAVTGVNPISSNSANCILGAMDQSNGIPFNYFNGWMDELRIWKVELTINQIRQMMNQEIQNNGGNVKGSIVPLDVPGLAWTNLDGYYQMKESTDIVNGYVLGKTITTINGKLRNIGTQQPETAPLPYTTRISDQDWSTDDTWTNFPVWDAPNSVAIDGSTRIDWNIVRTTHNVNSVGNKTVLGLLVNSNTLTANNNSKIEVSHYLKLDGKIDLVGMSQLIQTEGSELDVTSGGSIERDQQGQSNKYNYNYWSSPVSPINTTANNTDYTVGNILRDGTDPINPKIINWVGGYDGAPTNPISLARYWIYKFDDYGNAYANWNQIGETGSLRVGQGFTLKGSGAAGTTQNYTFVGKPNNGTINTNSVGSEDLLLTGNPYPSALDATAFINDNINSIEDGTLYFWEHYTTNNTHILRDYQGGYAVRNLSGGTPPSAIGVDFISGLGSSTKTPGQFIPIGQSFFVEGKVGSGGPIIYKNSQRAFVKEDHTSSNMMSKIIKDPKKDKYWTNNQSDKIVKDNYKRIRLGYNSENGYHRQVLLAFMNEKATSEMDYGYDGANFDDFPSDMYLLNGENELVISGEGFFDKNAIYPIGVKADKEGKVTFMIDALENFDSKQHIYIHDNENNSYHDIRTEKYEVVLKSGKNNSRFSLRFIDKTYDFVEKNTTAFIKITYLQDKNLIIIKNNIKDEIIQTVNLYNNNAQFIMTWEMDNQEQEYIQLPIKRVNPGLYIIKVKTSKRDYSKKIIIQ
ncbi:LamG-like jellyroll fold domain-containing protein [Flavobacterium sp. K5-23]|uniref:LamG-like jellyroll fold domain-containing protein n=1 Tax=Flavobacterium sp. K5-23 TaxID=2746225 RepID=UPI00200E01E8|nr:LamG-like jellyroll fold domain-containing protein [Flavobacterium sp. K5-23]UQD56262.1 T9SS type A sorting domain-containing protein [Flavobacterium sp. K5-23]